MKRIVIACALGVLVSASAARAVVLCAKRRNDGTFNASVKIREACRPSETQLNPGALGLAASCHHQFTDNGDGTVTDDCTSLVWEQKRNADGTPNVSDPHDADNGYTWTSASDGDLTNPDGTAFTVFLVALNTPPCFDGHCDWRLPTASELRSLLIEEDPCTVGPPCVPQAVTPLAVGINNYASYWSGSSEHASPGQAWLLNLNTGEFNQGFATKTDEWFVRAVRGGS